MSEIGDSPLMNPVPGNVGPSPLPALGRAELLCLGFHQIASLAAAGGVDELDLDVSSAYRFSEIVPGGAGDRTGQCGRLVQKNVEKRAFSGIWLADQHNSVGSRPDRASSAIDRACD